MNADNTPMWANVIYLAVLAMLPAAVLVIDWWSVT